MELTFRPTVDLISSTRRFVCAFYEPVLGDPDLLSRIGLATHELLENVLKYATDGHTVARIKLDGDDGERKLTIETTSTVTAERRAGLEAIFAEMASSADPFEFYQRTMRRSLHRRQGSGLGLARVWAEAEMVLTLGFLGDTVTIVATANVKGQPSS